MARLFLSYATDDRAFALRLATSLNQLGHTVWVDQWEIGVGDSIWSTIEAGVDAADYLIVVLSKHTRTSGWVEREVQVKYCEEIACRRTRILPVLIEDCSVPPFLRPKRFADFRVGYDIGLAQLAITLHTASRRTAQVATSTLHADEALFSSSPDTELCYTQDMLKRPPQLTEISVELGLPYIGKIAGLWKPDVNEQNAAWELYIELITRISVVGLAPDEGLLRESLTSLYIIFTTTRDILRTYGPAIARPKADGTIAFGVLALHVLNYALRPVLTTWHPLLLDYEHTRPAARSVFAHEQQWERAAALRQALQDTQHILLAYAAILAEVANVPPLYTPEPTTTT